MECYKGELVAVFTLFVMTSVPSWGAMAQEDFSGPIKCYNCFGDATNSSCSDPIYPRTEKSRNLEVIECDRGICLKWTYYHKNQLFMHRTCSERHDFKIMMIDGVCKSERNGNGYLCMCGKHLCNTASRDKLHTGIGIVTLVLTLVCIRNGIAGYPGAW